MTFDDFLAIWLALTIAVGYLLVGLWCLLLPRFIRWLMRQNVEWANAKLLHRRYLAGDSQSA